MIWTRRCRHTVLWFLPVRLFYLEEEQQADQKALGEEIDRDFIECFGQIPKEICLESMEKVVGGWRMT